MFIMSSHLSEQEPTSLFTSLCSIRLSLPRELAFLVARSQNIPYYCCNIRLLITSVEDGAHSGIGTGNAQSGAMRRKSATCGTYNRPSESGSEQCPLHLGILNC